MSNIQQGNVNPVSNTVVTTERETQPILHLRSEGKSNKTKSSPKSKNKDKSKPQVRWTEDVVDNEHMNKKKSKICCIFHPQREFGESSTDESSDSSSDSSDSSDDEMRSSSNKSNQPDPHGNCKHSHKHQRKSRKESSPNAYEKQPHYTNKSKLQSDNQE